MLAAALAPPMEEVLPRPPCRRNLLFHDVVELIDRGRLHSVEGRDAHDDVGAHVRGQTGEHFRRLVGVEIGEHDGDDLRVLEPDELGTARESIHFSASSPFVERPMLMRSMMLDALSGRERRPTPCGGIRRCRRRQRSRSPLTR